MVHYVEFNRYPFLFQGCIRKYHQVPIVHFQILTFTLLVFSILNDTYDHPFFFSLKLGFSKFLASTTKHGFLLLVLPCLSFCFLAILFVRQDSCCYLNVRT